MGRSGRRDRERCAPIPCCPQSQMRSSTPLAYGSTNCRSRLKKFCARSRRKVVRGLRRDAEGQGMTVRSNIVGIDSPEALERALRAAYYLADEGLATAAYLALALGKPL